jgi:DNA helicase HerA-like ATPase
MLQLLAELYASLPEAGDLDKPKLALFIDEAHLIFQDATEALLQQLETVIKLIRSKGVGIFFITQNPNDIPQAILGQLGLKIQHALRAFTAKDRQDIKKVAENYPETEYYKTEDLITQLGIGEAFVTLLNEKGVPTPLVHTMVCPPRSRMDVLTENEISAIVAKSKIANKYNQEVDSKSAYELLNEKLEEAGGSEIASKTESAKQEKGTLEKILENPVTRQIGRTAASIITRSLLGVLGLGGTTRKRKTNSWF